MIKIALCDDNRYLLGKLEELLYELAERHKLHIDVDCFEDGAKLLEKIKNCLLYTSDAADDYTWV